MGRRQHGLLHAAGEGSLGSASEGVLEAITRALQLDDAERAHLFDLARAARGGAQPPRRRAQPQQLRPSLQHLLDARSTVAADGLYGPEMSALTKERTVERSASWRMPAIWLLAVVLLALLWIAGALVPYYVNELDRLSADELTSGAWDPAQLWPATTGTVGQTVQAAGAFVSWPLMYVVYIASALGSGYLLKEEWSGSSRGERALLVTLAVLSVALTALILSPFGISISTWALD